MRVKKGKTDRFDGYAVNLMLDDEGDWRAHFVELPNVAAFAETPENALAELAIAWGGVKTSYRRRKEPIPLPTVRREFSGQFNVRIDKRLHRALAIEAAHAGVSLNALVSQKLAKTTRC